MSTTTAKKLTGNVVSWDTSLDGSARRQYIVTTLNYGMVRKLFSSNLFSAETGEGEQRVSKKARISHLRKAIESNQYTPTAFYASVKSSHKIEKKDKSVTIEVTPDNMFSLTDGGHRKAALEEIRLAGGKTQRMVDMLPITCMIHLEPDRTKENFLNLQDRLSVDSGQMLTMKIYSGQINEKKLPNYRKALELAKLLHADPRSHLYRMIRFDSQSSAPIKFQSIAPSRSSDLMTSLYGTSILTDDSEFAARISMEVFEIVCDCSSLLKSGNILSPCPDGTIGGSTMLVGLANAMIYRLRLENRKEITEVTKKLFMRCLHNIFDGETVDRDFSSQVKRHYIGNFVREFFRDIIEDEESVIGGHEGIPIPLCLLVGTSAFGVSKIDKPKGKRGRKPRLKLESKDIVVEDEEVLSSSQSLDIDTDEEWKE